MHSKNNILKTLILTSSLFLIGCGGGGTNSVSSYSGNGKDGSGKYGITYKGLTFFHKDLAPQNYKLSQLSDGEFNALSASNKLRVANNLLGSLFFGYPQKELKNKIDSGSFISSLRNSLTENTTDKEWLENHILDKDKFEQYGRWNEPQAITILSRFYAMKNLDKYFLKNWVAYILTQTIMFSPAYELETTHTSNIANVYNSMVDLLMDDSGLRYTTYRHMMSESNWRRFRSPEDNGREMLEIYLQDTNDAHVPIAAQALKNWKLDTDSDTLEIGLNHNTKPLALFNTTIKDGDDFYREMVKTADFIKGVTQRLVSFFFPGKSTTAQNRITNSIVSSHPEKWEDILLQVIFSKEYLLHNKRAKSAEETFYSLSKKLGYTHRKSTFSSLKEYLEKMHQASMKYKLGKLERAPLDTLSFAYYHKYIREYVLLRHSDSEFKNNYSSWQRVGWSNSLTALDNFNHGNGSDTEALNSFIGHLFHTIIARDATTQELIFFRDHLTETRDGKIAFKHEFDMFTKNDNSEKEAETRRDHRNSIALLVLDYLSRLSELYIQEEIK